jgi:hypothetical protein
MMSPKNERSGYIGTRKMSGPMSGLLGRREIAPAMRLKHSPGEGGSRGRLKHAVKQFFDSFCWLFCSPSAFEASARRITEESGVWPVVVGLALIIESYFPLHCAIMPGMKMLNKTPTRRNVTIVVNPKDPRMATVKHDDKVLFTIKTDVSGMHPSIIVVATETHLKSMEKGKSGIALWNGTVGLDPQKQELP